jgi:hypothetical protein
MFGYGIIPAGEHGMAAADTHDAEHDPLDYAVLHDRLLGVE